MHPIHHTVRNAVATTYARMDNAITIRRLNLARAIRLSIQCRMVCTPLPKARPTGAAAYQPAPGALRGYYSGCVGACLIAGGGTLPA